MRTFERTSKPITADADGIAEAQTLSGAGDVELDGVALIDEAGSPYDGKILLDPPRRVIIDSAGDDSGVTFTIYGTDRVGTPIEETVQGANASSVTSTMVYKTVERIAASGATADDIEIGWGTEHIGPWIILGNARGHYNAGWQLAVEGTVSCSLEASYRNILRERIKGDYEPDAVQLDTAMTEAAEGALETPVAAIRLIQDSGAGSAVLRVVPSRAL